MFGKKKKEESPYTEPPSLPSPDALPTKAAIFDQFRTNAYENQNAASNYLGFWVAMMDDKSAQRWRVVHCMVFDLDKKDGLFKTDPVIENASFLDAMRKIAQLELMAATLADNYKKIDMEKTYPPAQYPEFKEHFFNIAYFKDAAEIEKLVCDTSGAPHQLLNGLIYEKGVFTRSAVGGVVNGQEGAEGNPYTKTKFEPGVLSDVFNASFSSGPDFETLVKVGDILADTDEFIGRMVGFYMDLQEAVGLEPSLSGVKGLTPEEQAQMSSQAKTYRRGTDFDDLFDSLSLANGILDSAEEKGLLVTPFRKDVAECKIYLYLLKASVHMDQYRESLSLIDGTGRELLQHIRQLSNVAKEEFMSMGGTESRYDVLKSWIVSEKREKIPAAIPNLLTRYYGSRRKAMEKIRANGRNAFTTARILPHIKPTA